MIVKSLICFFAGIYYDPYMYNRCLVNDMRTIMWFRTNLRVVDNPALAQCTRATIFVYCWDKDADYGNNYTYFLLDSLKDLAEDLDRIYGGRLHIFYDHPHKLIPRLCGQYGINRVITCQNFVIEDLTKLISHIDATFTVVPDGTLFPLGLHVTKQNIQRASVCSFMNRAVSPPCDSRFTGSLIMIPCLSFDELTSIVGKRPRSDTIVGGRQRALNILTEGVGYLLVPYIEIGCISIREAYAGLQNHTSVICLYQRELMLNIAHVCPQMLQCEWDHAGISTTCAKLCTHHLSKKQRALLICWETAASGYSDVDEIMSRIDTYGTATINEFERSISFLQCVFSIHWSYARAYFNQKIIVAPLTIFTEMMWLWLSLPASYLDALLLT